MKKIFLIVTLFGLASMPTASNAVNAVRTLPELKERLRELTIVRDSAVGGACLVVACQSLCSLVAEPTPKNLAKTCIAAGVSCFCFKAALEI